MERITSFTIDHDVLVPGFYISRKDGDITTGKDFLRLCLRNFGVAINMRDEPLSKPVPTHSVEHMFATYIRNSEIADSVIYFGPMGCQTGFYLLVRDVEPKKVFQITKEVLSQIIAHEGEVFGASAAECGHYENLDLEIAKEECRTYLAVLEKQTNMEFSYPTK